MRRVAALSAGSGALWIVVAYPAWRLGGGQALTYSALAMALCLIPGVATLMLADSLGPGSQPLLLLGARAVRMAVVLGGGLALSVWVLPIWPEPGLVMFWLWLLLFYLSTLALDVGLLVADTARKRSA